MASLGQRCRGPVRLAAYKSALPAAVCSSPFIPPAVLVLLLTVAAAGGTGPAAKSAGCPLTGAVTQRVPPDLSIWAKPSGVPGLGLGLPGKCGIGACVRAGLLSQLSCQALE